VITGYWFLDPPPSWRPPEELEAFIEAGDPPVYIGFGSMQGRRSHELISESIPAVRAAGMRAVLAAPESARAALEPPSEVHLCADVPHAWLFPRMAAIVHHAGAGTTGAALRAGRPSVVLPLTADQGFWARRVHRLGAAPPPLTAGRATAESLAEAIRLAVRDPAIRSRAMEIQERIDAEDGVGCAVREIARVISARQ
jgi:UDP:flavonoid glycosyltransferase YjiC (YdhE family)